MSSLDTSPYSHCQAASLQCLPSDRPQLLSCYPLTLFLSGSPHLAWLSSWVGFFQDNSIFFGTGLTHRKVLEVQISASLQGCSLFRVNFSLLTFFKIEKYNILRNTMFNVCIVQRTVIVIIKLTTIYTPPRCSLKKQNIATSFHHKEKKFFFFFFLYL